MTFEDKLKQFMQTSESKMSDINRNLLLLNQLYWQAGRKSEAQKVLLEALALANRTGFINHFVIEGEAMAQQLRQLIQLNTLPELEQHRAQRILREVGNADDRDVALGLHPLMGLRVLQLNRIIHGSSSQINFSVFFMSVFRPADAGRTLLISEADLSGEAIKRGIELRVVEAVVHLREAAAQANDIL